jgi:hypothetical protein
LQGDALKKQKPRFIAPAFVSVDGERKRTSTFCSGLDAHAA